MVKAARPGLGLVSQALAAQEDPCEKFDAKIDYEEDDGAIMCKCDNILDCANSKCSRPGEKFFPAVGNARGCRCEQRNDWARSVKSPVETAALAFCEAALKKKATKGGKKEDSVPPVSVCEEQLSNRKATGAYGRLHTVLQEAPKTAAWHLTRVCRDECEELVNMTNRNMGKMQSDLHGAWTPHVMSVGETCAMRVVKKVEAEIFGCCGRSCGWNGRSCISWPFFDEQQKADWQAECCTEYNVSVSVVSKHRERHLQGFLFNAMNSVGQQTRFGLLVGCLNALQKDLKRT